ncbi:DUF4291 domain-containing protein [Streptomyces mirabilis]
MSPRESRHKDHMPLCQYIRRPEIKGSAAPPQSDDRLPGRHRPWIKPSFLWMMYRCGWATKAGQETVLAVEITRDGFEWALRHSCPSSYVRGLHPDRSTWQRRLKRAPARVQWDPERDPHLRPLTYRSLQLGLSGEAVKRYADEWTVAISDVTPLAREIHELVRRSELDAAAALLPKERPYPAGDELLAALRP